MGTSAILVLSSPEIENTKASENIITFVEIAELKTNVFYGWLIWKIYWKVNTSDILVFLSFPETENAKRSRTRASENIMKFVDIAGETSLFLSRIQRIK